MLENSKRGLRTQLLLLLILLLLLLCGKMVPDFQYQPLVKSNFPHKGRGTMYKSLLILSTVKLEQFSLDILSSMLKL